MRVLNLYAGIGGNRKLWTNCTVTAVENHPGIAAQYGAFYPEDTVIITDAHEFLINNHRSFDFVWSSYPCETHSQLNRYRILHKTERYPDLGLYQEIIFLKTFFKGKFVVENVDPYYDPLIRPQRCGRHLFWSNFYIQPITIPSIGAWARPKQEFQCWVDHLGILPDKIPGLNAREMIGVLRNCVHPGLGLHVMKCATMGLYPTLFD